MKPMNQSKITGDEALALSAIVLFSSWSASLIYSSVSGLWRDYKKNNPKK